MKLLLATSAGAFIALYAAFALFALTHRVEARDKPCPIGAVHASWYGKESGHKTATGARFDGSQWLVAHKTLPMGTMLRLTYLGKTVTVPVGDRGPYIAGRVLDLSEAVANALRTKAAGVACVVMERL